MADAASRTKSSPSFTLGRRSFAKISAVEGIALSADMEARFRRFDDEATPAAERRAALCRMFGKAR